MDPFTDAKLQWFKKKKSNATLAFQVHDILGTGTSDTSFIHIIISNSSAFFVLSNYTNMSNAIKSTYDPVS